MEDDRLKEIVKYVNLDDIAMENSSEIEFEINNWTSLIYVIDEDKYYVYKLDTYDEEEYRIPIDIDDDTDLMFNISIKDKKDFKYLIDTLKGKGDF